MKDMENRRDMFWWFSEIRKSPEHGYPSLGVLIIEGNEQPEAAGMWESMIDAQCV